MKIRIGIPIANTGDLSPELKTCLNNVRISGCVFDIRIMKGALIAHNRNSLISPNCYKQWQSDFEFDYFLSLDSDTLFTSDNVEMLLKAKKEIITGACSLRGFDDLIGAGHWDRFSGHHPESQALKYSDTGIQRVDWVGAGFLLISSDALRKIRYPWFRYTMIRDGDLRYQTGEDVGFSMNAEKSKIEIYCNCDCKVEHKTGE